MKKIIAAITVLFALTVAPSSVFAAGVSASGGGTKTAGQNFTVTVTASGATFDSLQGKISVSGPVSIVSFSAGSATWLPGKTPANGNEFVGITSPTSSLTVARITLKGTKPGSGSVSLSGVKLARSGSIVGTTASGTNFTIVRAPTPPGAITVASSTHPDQNQSYEATTIELSWDKPSGVTEFSYLLDQTPDTTPPAQKTSSDTLVKYENQAIGTYYFHIRAKNADGWGATTHFKINIKEPDPKVDEALPKPIILKIEKADTWQTNLEDGTVSGIIISGTSEPGYKVNLAFEPVLTLPEGTPPMSAETDSDGAWQFTLSSPIKSGFYKLTAQGQKEKVLTPASDTLKFEITLAKGGNLRILSDKDAFAADESKGNNKTFSARVLGYAKEPLAWIMAALALGGAVTSTKIYRHKKAMNRQ